MHTLRYPFLYHTKKHFYAYLRMLFMHVFNILLQQIANTIFSIYKNHAMYIIINANSAQLETAI